MNPVKVRVLGLAVLDAAVDVVVPLVVSLLAVAAGLSASLALAVSGVLVGIKVGLGRLHDWRLDRHAAFVLTAGVLALACLIGLVAAGSSDTVAAGVAGAVTAVPVLVTLLGRGRVDGVALLVLAEIVASVAVTLVSDDVRFVLARPAVYTAVAGLAALVTCVRGRPLMLDASAPMAAAGDPDRARAFEDAWRHSVAFRRLQRTTTAGLGVVLLAEAALRVGIVYGSDHPDLAVTGVAAQLPGIALVVASLIALRLVAVPRARRIVDGFREMRPDGRGVGHIACN